MRILLLLIFTVASITVNAQLTDLKQGMKITSSTTIRTALYQINAPDASGKVSLETTPVVEISGNNMIVNFNNAILRGSNDKQLPDEFYGLAIRIKGGKNITIKNLRAKGFKVVVIATDVENLMIENCDFSYNYRQHLNSTQEKEDISDWMSYHQNENDEWLRYGAAIYLRNCNGGTIYNNTVTGGQCALMMSLCNDGHIYNNDFSFNSGIGIGMYRSNGNSVSFNKLDWNVRGHSEGVYNRGQDSAAILLFEQCNNNSFHRNSATHSGDGFFLWAGQTTMDTGKGGCNDNIIDNNDFSHAPTNGIEVTFSRNTITNNRLEECDHGIWGGYSFETNITSNIFRNNRIAIAIEHGQENTILANAFLGNKESIRLWARKEQPKDWGYAQKRDTRSRGYSIVKNFFEREGIVYNISNTLKISLRENRKLSCGLVYKLDSVAVRNIDSSRDNQRGDLDARSIAGIKEHESKKSVMLPADHPRGRRHIRITEWGPYNFRYPLLWRTNPLDSSGLLKFDVLGPGGKWKLVGSKGVEAISKSIGSFPDSISARKLKGHTGEIYIELEYVQTDLGAMRNKPMTPFGEDIPFGKSYRFAFRDSRVEMQWKASWFNFDSISSPVRDTSFIKKLQAGEPFMARQVKDLNFAWWGGLSPGQGGKPYTQFLTVAETDTEVEPGNYELSVTWDDAARVWVDGKLILNEWNPSLYKFDESPNRRIKLTLGGKHRIKVEHAELGGFATISVKLKKL